MFKTLKFDPPFLGMYKKLIPSLASDGILSYVTPKRDDDLYIGAIERWLILQPRYLDNIAHGILYGYYRRPHSSIFHQVIRDIDGAQMRIHGMLGIDKPAEDPRGTAMMQMMARKLVWATEQYKQSVNLGYRDAGVFDEYLSYNPISTVLEDGDALMGFLHTEEGKEFAENFGIDADLEDPIAFLLSLQILLLAEQFIPLSQERYEVLIPKPAIPPEAKLDWRERVLSRLMASISKLSAFADAGTKMFIKPVKERENASHKGEWVRIPALEYYDCNLSEKERRENKRSANATIIAEALWQRKEFVAEAARHKVYSVEALQKKILTILNHNCKS